MGLITTLAAVFPSGPVLVVTDSWFGNNGLLKPLRHALGSRAHLLSRLRVNAVLHDLPVALLDMAGCLAPECTGSPSEFSWPA